MSFIPASASGVTSVAGNTGVVTTAQLTTALSLTSYAPLASPALTGSPTIGGFAAVAVDGTGKVPTSLLPASIQGALNYQGAWNASTNVPTLVSSTGTKGYYYTVSTIGTTTIDTISQWNVGDHIAFNGSTWEKFDGVASEVISVAGNTGVVTATQISTALGLGGAALLNVGTAASTVAAGNDSRIVGALQAANIPAATGQLLGGSGTAGTAAAITLGTNLSFTSTTLNVSTTAGTVRTVIAAGGITVLATDGVILINKTAGAATAVTLEASPVTSALHVIKDGKGDAATNNITITPASGTIDGSASYVINVARSSITLVYTGAEWSIL